MILTVSISRLRQLEKRLPRKLDIVDERTKMRFPIICSYTTPGLYYLTRWQDGKFVKVAATREEVDEYRKGGKGPVIFLPEEKHGLH